MPSTGPTELPYPPLSLIGRIGPMGDEDPVATYRETGQLHRELLTSVLPSDWSWGGKRVLDFGCGSGRMLRQFTPEACDAEFWGCDLDASSVDWLQANFCPPFNVFHSSEAPGLPQDDGFFDLIYAFSVYTHFTDNWAGWLLEHHRVLAEGGLLFATFLGEGMLEPLTGEQWNEDTIGMNPLLHGYSWDLGGPIAINSPWWIRTHWGRAFEIVELRPVIDEGVPSHGLVLARKKPVQLTVGDLARLEPNEPREILSLKHHAKQLAAETVRLRVAHEAQSHQSARIDSLEQELGQIRNSLSWQLTAPLRAAKRHMQRSREARGTRQRRTLQG